MPAHEDTPAGRRRRLPEAAGAPTGKRGGRAGTILLVCLLLMICVWSAFRFLEIRAEEMESAGKSQYFRSFVHVPVGAEHPPEKAGRGTDSPEEAADGTAVGAVDFEGLQQNAPDAAAWIRIPGTEVDYPVVQGDDNAFYLSHSPDGAHNRAGSIFIDAWNSGDFRDPNTVLYGHRMNDGSMFASLHKLRDPEHLKDHHQIYVWTRDGQALSYHIFCVEIVSSDSAGAPYRLRFETDEEFAAWLTRKRTDVEAALPADLSAGSRVLTLSTCVQGAKDRRLIVQAYLEETDGQMDSENV